MWKFRIVLWMLAVMMRKAARNNPDFQEKLKDKDFSFQIKTEDAAVARSYSIANQSVKSRRGVIADPAFTISFKDAKTGLGIITSSNKNAFMQGIQNKDIVISGDLSLVMWFQSISKYLKPRKKKK